MLWTSRKKTFAKKDSLWLTRHKFIIMHTAYQREAAGWAVRPLTAFLLSESTLMKEFLESYFDQCAKICDVQSELLSYLSSFASLSTNQSVSITTNQNMKFQPIRTALFGPPDCKCGSLICITVDQPGWGRALSLLRWLPLCVREAHTFSFQGRLPFPGLQTIYLNKVSPNSTPQIENSW